MTIEINNNIINVSSEFGIVYFRLKQFEIEHKETLLITTNIQTDRKKPISNKKELERFLKSFKKLKNS